LNEYQQDCFLKPRPAEELYDVQNDPYQFKNLAENTDFQKELKKMRALLDGWKEKYNDRVPENPTPD